MTEETLVMLEVVVDMAVAIYTNGSIRTSQLIASLLSAHRRKARHEPPLHAPGVLLRLLLRVILQVYG